MIDHTCSHHLPLADFQCLIGAERGSMNNGAKFLRTGRCSKSPKDLIRSLLKASTSSNLLVVVIFLIEQILQLQTGQVHFCLAVSCLALLSLYFVDLLPCCQSQSTVTAETQMNVRLCTEVLMAVQAVLLPDDLERSLCKNGFQFLSA